MLTRSHKLEAKRNGRGWAAYRLAVAPEHGIFDSSWVDTGGLELDARDRATFAFLVAASAAHAWRKGREAC